MGVNALEESFRFGHSIKHMRNPYKRMLAQNRMEIKMLKRYGASRQSVSRLERIVVPISVLETMIYPFTWLLSVLLFYIMRKQKRVAAYCLYRSI